MATREYLEEGGATRNQQLYRMGQDSPPSPAPTVQRGEGPAGSGGLEIAGTRAAPTGKRTGRASRYAVGFLERNQGAADLAQQMIDPAPVGPNPSAEYADLGDTEIQRLYQSMRGGLSAEQRAELDGLAARLADHQGGQ